MFLLLSSDYIVTTMLLMSVGSNVNHKAGGQQMSFYPAREVGLQEESVLSQAKNKNLFVGC